MSHPARWIGLFGLLAVLLPVCAQAQPVPGEPVSGAPAPGEPVQELETLFERDVNRYRWSADYRLARPVAGWDVTAVNRFQSDAYLLFDDRLSFRDENRLAWSARRSLTGPWSTGLFGDLGWFSQSRVFSQAAYTGLRYAPSAVLWVEPRIGVAVDHRPGAVRSDGGAPLRQDIGPAYGFGLSLRPPAFDAYRFHLDADGAWEVTTPRRGHALRVAGAAERIFETTRLSTTVAYSNVRRDAYQAVSFLNRGSTDPTSSETIEATTSDTLQLGVQLDTPFYRQIHLSSRVDFNANNRYIRSLRTPEASLFFDSDFHRRTLDAEVELSYDARRLTSRLAFLLGADIERRELANSESLPPTQAAQKRDLLEQADFEQSSLTVLFRNRFDPSPRLAVTAEATASILRHDTPDANQDDRDEAFYSGQIGIVLRLSRFLQADVRLLGTYYHTVYLKARRSAENNVQRSLRLRPAFTWTPAPRTRVRVSTEVRATYTVDDFVLGGRRPTDQAARELRYDAEIEQDLGNGVQLLGTGGMSDLHLGRFLRNQFAEIPFDTLRTYNGWIRLRTGRRVAAELGVRAFIRTDFERATTVRYRRLAEDGTLLRDEAGEVRLSTITRPGRRWIEQIGPTAGLVWSMHEGSSLRLDGWVNRQRVWARLYGDLPEGLEEHIRSEARRGSRTLIPNLALTLFWRF